MRISENLIYGFDDEEERDMSDFEYPNVLFFEPVKGVYGAGKAIICAPYQRNDRELQ